jgi:DNA-directed RNA polymerase sigma subunit (sigma70/sigma32)
LRTLPEREQRLIELRFGFTSRYSGSELATLSGLLSHLPMTGRDCTRSSSA